MNEQSTDERYTARALEVMQLANDAALSFNHEYIGTEHILLGLVKQQASMALAVLKNLRVDWRKVRLEVEKIMLPGNDPVIGVKKLSGTPRAIKVIELAVQEARDLSYHYVGTEHLLLGLLREQQGVAAQVLMRLGLDVVAVRDEAWSLLGHGLADENENETAGPFPRRCCFCGQEIEPGSIDPCLMTVVTSSKKTQLWNSHAECLRSRLADDPELKPRAF